MEHYILPPIICTLTSLVTRQLNQRAPKTNPFTIPKHRLTINSPTVQPHQCPNIVIIINESLSVLSPAIQTQCLPFTTASIKKNNWLDFSNCYTPSTLTMATLPAILTGIHPLNAAKGFYTAPLLWDWGKALGMDTSLLSSQLYSYGNLDQFCFSTSLDQHITRENFEFAPTVNDLGIDDLISCQMLKPILENTTKPFLSLIQTNNLHYPFLQKSVMLDKNPKFKIAYHNALWLLDKTIAEIMNTLTPYLNNTILIITSDHGEDIQRGQTNNHRSGSFENAHFKIPFYMHVPESLLSPNQQAILTANQRKITTSLDIIPTIADLLHLLPSNRETITQLDGQSLCQPISNERHVIGSNYSPTFVNDYNNAFGIAKERFRFNYSDQNGPELYDNQKDPNHTQNIWNQSSKQTQDMILDIINQSPELKQQFKNQYTLTEPITLKQLFKSK